MSIRDRLSKIEKALSSSDSSETKITSDDLDHLSDDELDQLESIVAKAQEIVGEGIFPLCVPDDEGGVPGALSWIIANDAEYFAAVRRNTNDSGKRVSRYLKSAIEEP